MSGGIRSIGQNVWEVRLEAGRDPVTGKRNQISRSVRGSKREAQKVLNKLSSEADAGRFSGTSLTFKQLSERWLSHVEGNLSPTTIQTYRGYLTNRILPALGDLPVNKIRSVDLDDFYRALEKRAMLSPSSIRQIHSIIRRAFRQAMRWEWVSANPAANASPPRIAKTDLTPPDPGQVADLILRSSEWRPEFGHFLHIAASTGARRGEICALRWNNLNLESGTLAIERAIIEVKGGIFEKDTKTHASRRIKLDPVTLEVFEDQHYLMSSRAASVGMSIANDSFIFSDEPNGRIAWRPSDATKNFMAIRNELGYDSIRLHDLRHFAATRLMAAGIPVRQVSGRLGHANPATTLSVYTHFLEAIDQDSADVMSAILPKSKRPPVKKAVNRAATAPPAKKTARPPVKKAMKKAASSLR